MVEPDPRKAAGRFRVPILTYHRVCDDPNPALAEWAVRPAAFRRQMRLIRLLGYRVLTLDALLDACDRGKQVGKVAVITFDDGYLDTVTVAAPILDAAGFPATVFVVSDRVGETAAWDQAFGGDMAPLATWGHLRDLQSRGWEIGLHTRTHPRLSALPEPEALAELTGGKAILERQLGSPVRTAAYPYGDYAPATTSAAAAAGLRATVTIAGVIATETSERHELPRVAVMRGDTLVDFIFLLWTGRRLSAWVRSALGLAARRIHDRPIRRGYGSAPGG